MITDYSIDKLTDRIQDNRTKSYFNEVLSCYYSGNYRSAVVMLYSVVIADLIFKLQRLKDIYEDEPTKKILAQIEQMQTENPASPAWENTLREELVKNKRIISTTEAVHLENLQKDRHLCAHPVIKDGAELHMPEKSSVYAHMVIALKEILTVSPFLEKQLLEQILDDIADNRRILRNAHDIEAYISEMYLKKISSDEIEVNLFAKLWKFVFKLTDAECKKNRVHNFVFLQLLFKRNEVECLLKIQRESERMSRNVDIKLPETLELFVKFCNLFPKVYEELDTPFKISFRSSIDKYSLLNNICFFLHKDFKEYFENTLLHSVNADDDIKYVEQYTEKKLGKEQSLRIPIAVFSKSGSFDEAANNYMHLISSKLKEMTLSNLTELLDAISENSQNRCSWKVQENYPKIKDAVITYDKDFDFSKYPFIE